MFVLRLYLKAWYTCQSAVEALRNDLLFLKALVDYRTIDPSTANAALKSFGGYLWYLSESLVGLVFFDAHRVL